MVEELFLPPDVTNLICKQNLGVGMPCLFHERLVFDMFGTDRVSQIR